MAVRTESVDLVDDCSSFGLVAIKFLAKYFTKPFLIATGTKTCDGVETYFEPALVNASRRMVAKECLKF